MAQKNITDVTVNFIPFDDAADWHTYTGPLTPGIQAVMDAFTEREQGTCTTYAANGYATYQHRPLMSREQKGRERHG